MIISLKLEWCQNHTFRDLISPTSSLQFIDIKKKIIIFKLFMGTPSCFPQFLQRGKAYMTSSMLLLMT